MPPQPVVNVFYGRTPCGTAPRFRCLKQTVGQRMGRLNGHMNDAAYAIVFSRSVDALMDRIGLDPGARKRTGQSLFTLQMMLHYFKEAKEGDALAVSCQSARA